MKNPFSESARLKRKARRIYLSVMAQLDSVDCGLSILTTIRPSVGVQIDEFRRVWTRLQEIDPETPAGCPL